MRKIVWKAYETAKERYHSLFEKLDDGDTYMRAQADRVTEEDRTILAALAGVEEKHESEADDN
jgi:hypothetical protein